MPESVQKRLMHMEKAGSVKILGPTEVPTMDMFLVAAAQNESAAV